MGTMRKERGDAPVFELLEPRLLLSGDPFDTASIIESDPALAEMLAAEAERFAPGELLIKLRESGGSFGAAPTSVVVADNGSVVDQPTSPLADLLISYGIDTIEPVFPSLISAEPLGADPLQIVAVEGELLDPERQDLGRWYHVELPAGVDIQEAIDAFAANPDVEFAEPSYEWGLTDQIPRIIEGLPDGTTDPGYDNQWFHTNARIPNAWEHLNLNGVYPGGLHDVVVAVIDTGVDYDHEDLIGNMWVNAGEIPGNEIDDDGNGFVDDIHGANVVSDGRSHSGDPIDLSGHGTHVAGIIAAQAFNDLGGVGVAFNVQIMGVRAAQYSGVLTTTDIAEGILYAADNGADVINMSFGGYQRSQIVIDALAVALNQAVLVAAAGNDSLPADGAPMYPAALPWVLGVMASTPTGDLAWFSNYDTRPDTSYEYEIAAPGVSIYSTVPGSKYASWSGTSMAAPVVSGVAALMRSFFWQSEIYSSRFVMGSIAASGGVVDAYKALTEPPTPGVSMLENWLFDDASIDEGNDGDGRIDSGETVHMAIELMNRSGMAENVTGTLRAHAPGAPLPDPYVTITTDTVDFGDIGPFNTKDNGFIYDEGGVIIGVETPFVFEVSPDCPNDHVIPFELTVDFQDGWDEDHTAYTRISRFNYIVQRGRNIPTVISEDTELTSEDYWIAGGPVLIEAGATLTIREGTQVQWGAISDDPYNPGPQSGYMVVRGTLKVEGTEDRPVAMFPSYLVSGQETVITVESGGRADISYATILNPELSGIGNIDHCYLDWDAYSSSISAEYISNSILHKLRGSDLSADRFDTSLFDADWLGPQGGASLTNCTFLQDNEANKPLTVYPQLAFNENITYERYESDHLYYPTTYEGDTYVTMPMRWPWLNLAEAIANYYGGHITSVRNSDEEAFLEEYIETNRHFGGTGGGGDRYIIGLTDEGTPGQYRWIDGLPMDYTNWATDQPADLSGQANHVVWISKKLGSNYFHGWRAALEEASTYWWGGGRMQWHSYILRLPGEDWTVEQLEAPFDNGEMLAYVREHYRGDVINNALLNPYWDPNLSHWMRVNAPGGANGYTSMQDKVV